MEKLGQGVSGVVYRPAIECGSCEGSPNEVGKVFDPQDDHKYWSERKIHEDIMSRIDPHGYFTPRLTGTCQPPEDKWFQLCFRYGGQSLKSARLPKSTISVRGIMGKPALPVYYGLIQMAKNNLIHEDLRLDNLVYNSETDRLMIIDFGVMLHTSEYQQLVNKAIVFQLRSHLPPELLMLWFRTYIKPGKIPNVELYMEFIGNEIAELARECFLGSRITPEFLRRDYLTMLSQSRRQFERIKDASYSKIDVHVLGVSFLQLYAARRIMPSLFETKMLINMVRPNVFARWHPAQLHDWVQTKMA